VSSSSLRGRTFRGWVHIQAAESVSLHEPAPGTRPKEDTQKTDRAYRIGQKRTCTSYYPVVYAEDFMTFERQAGPAARLQRGLAEDMLTGREK